jgi:hypothetical protein
MRFRKRVFSSTFGSSLESRGQGYRKIGESERESENEPDAGVVDFIHTESGLEGRGEDLRVDVGRKGNHQAELDAALTRALTVTLE